MRICRPELWVAAAAITTGYLIGWIVAISVFWNSLNFWPLLCIVAVVLLDLVRANIRAAIARGLFADVPEGRWRRAVLLERWATPLVAAAHAAVVWSAAFGRRVEWAGVLYEVLGPRKTRVLRRAA